MDLIVFNFYKWQKACYQIPSEKDKYKTLARDKFKTLEEPSERRERGTGKRWERGGEGRKERRRIMGEGWERKRQNTQEIGLKRNKKGTLLLSATKAITGYPF